MKADIQRRIMMGETQRAIGGVYGVSSRSISEVVRRWKLASPARAYMNMSDRLKGKSAFDHRKRSAEMKRRWKDPEYAARMGAAVSASRRRPATLAKIRGFDVPPHLADDYHHLTYRKKIPAAEAAQILGIPVKGKT